jgi:ABC-type multidrug transport system ATPase subunit
MELRAKPIRNPWQMMNPTIELQGLEVQLGGRTILRGLTGVLKSRAIGLLGPNGAGKSTLINTLLGFHSPSKGSARVLGLDCQANGQALRSLVGYMPENDAFISKMSGVRFVRYMAEISGLPREQAMERAHEAFVYVGLGEARYRPVGTYSLGMKQLAKLAQAIAHGPKLLILDEPTNGMDPPARKRLIELIREIREASEICLLLSSHLLRDVEETCDEVLILRNGKIASQVSGVGNNWCRSNIHVHPGGSRVRVRGIQQRPHQGGDAGRRRNQGSVQSRRGKRRANSADELPARFTGRHLSQCDGTDRSAGCPYLSADIIRTSEG